MDPKRQLSSFRKKRWQNPGSKSRKTSTYVILTENGQFARGHFKEQNRSIWMLARYTETWWKIVEQSIDVPEKLTDAENVAFSLNTSECANMTSQLRPGTSGLFHVEEWGASAWTSPSASQPHSSVFQPNSNNQPTVLVSIWSTSACWVSYWIGHELWEAMDFTSESSSKRKFDPFQMFLELLQNFYGLFRQIAAISSPRGLWGKIFDFFRGK